MDKKRIIVLAIASLLIFSFAYYFFIGKTCDDESCFDLAARQCRPATFLKTNNGNVFKYEIIYSIGENCKMDISVIDIGSNTPRDLARLFEDKSMTCSIPKAAFTSEFLKLNSALDYCHGPLKEAMYELMIQRLYDLAAKQMGDVVFEIENTLKEAI